MGILFAVFSMLFAGTADFVFKGYLRRSGQAMGNFLAGVGFVWASYFAISIAFSGRIHMHAWPISLAAGTASILGNVFLAAAMRRLDGGVCSTVYRLNLVLVVILAVVFLNEPITPAKLAAVALGVIAVALVFQRSDQPGGSGSLAGRSALPFLALIMAGTLRAIMGLLYKVGVNHGVGRNEFLMISGLCWLAGGLICGAVLGEPLAPTRRGWRYALIAGLIICGDVYFLALAVKYGQASVVVPVSQLGFAAAIILNCAFLAEKLTPKRLVALASAVLCIIVMSRA